jgi:hypothetical protein
MHEKTLLHRKNRNIQMNRSSKEDNVSRNGSSNLNEIKIVHGETETTINPNARKPVHNLQQQQRGRILHKLYNTLKESFLMDDKQFAHEMLQIPDLQTAIKEKNQEKNQQIEKRIEKQVLKEQASEKNEIMKEGALYGTRVSLAVHKKLRRLHTLENKAYLSESFDPIKYFNNHHNTKCFILNPFNLKLLNYNLVEV